MAGFWGSRKKERAELAGKDAELSRRAAGALVSADERIRTTSDELAFAQIELGGAATADLRAALDAVRHHLGEAFTLNQLNHDTIPDTPEELRTRWARIIQLCEWAEELLDDRTEALAAPIARARRAPEIIAGIREDVVRLTERIPAAEKIVTRLGAHYSEQALRSIAGNPHEAARLVEFAAHSADVCESRRQSGQREQANLALETSIEAVRRATTLLDAVDAYEVDALRAASTLAAIVDDSREDLRAARDLLTVPAVAAAAAELERALAALPPAGTPSDPLQELTALRAANAAHDSAVAAARERAARVIPPEAHVQHWLEDADRQIGVARSVISGHRGWIGAEARTRLAEAERLRLDLPARGTPIPEDDREEVLAQARRCGTLAAQALQLAQRDIDSSRPPDDNWGPSRGGRPRGGGDLVGGILGGLVIGSILDGIFD